MKPFPVRNTLTQALLDLLFQRRGMGGGGGTGVDQLIEQSMVFTALFKKFVKQF